MQEYLALICSPSCAICVRGSVLTDIMLFNFHTRSAELAQSLLYVCAKGCLEAVAPSFGVALLPRVLCCAWHARVVCMVTVPMRGCVGCSSATQGRAEEVQIGTEMFQNSLWHVCSH
jgi:hypothetical protein